MDPLRVELAGGAHSPHVRIIASPLYSLYHWVAGLGPMPAVDDPPLLEAVRLMTAARFPRGRHGPWDRWEAAIPAARTVDEVIQGLGDRQRETAEQVGRAMELALPGFLSTVWPAQQSALDEAVATIQGPLASALPAMVQAQAEGLRLHFPDAVDVYLVVACYDPAGAYSHPTTIDVTQYRGSALGESLLHELTHVADVETSRRGSASLKHEVSAAVEKQGLDGAIAWTLWHAVIFASSGYQVRRFVDPAHGDYAERRGLYRRFGLPGLAAAWSSYATGAISAHQLVDALVADAGSAAHRGPR